MKVTAVVNTVRILRIRRTHKDELNVTLLLDNSLSDEAENFAPYFSTMDVNKLYSVSKFVSLLGPGTNIVRNYLDWSNNIDKGTDTIVDKLQFVDVK